MSTSPLFIGNFEFEGKESPLSLTVWHGDQTYHFSTNFIGIYPCLPMRLSEAKKKTIFPPVIEKKASLEEKLREHDLKKTDFYDVRPGEFCSEITDNTIVQFLMDKRDYDKLDKDTKKEFATCHKQSLMWQGLYLRKVEFEPWLLNILEEKNNLDSLFKSLYRSMLRSNKSRAKESLKPVIDFIKKEYTEEDFDNRMIPLLFNTIGYKFKDKESRNKVIHIFKETRRQFKNEHHYINAQKKLFRPLGIWFDYPNPTNKSGKKQIKKLMKRSYGERLFENCKRVFGERGIDEVVIKEREIYIQKIEQGKLLEDLKRLLDDRKTHLNVEEYVEDIKYQLENLFLQVQDFNVESKTRKDFRKIMHNKLRDAASYPKTAFVKAQQINKKKQSLEEKIKKIKNTNKAFYDYDNQRMFLFLDIMHRNKEKKLYFDGINLKEMLSARELIYKTPLVLFDIEKFQYGTPKEVVNAIVMIIRTALGKFIRTLDVNIKSDIKTIEGFEVNYHRFIKKLVKSAADNINPRRPFLHFTHGSYDWEHLKETRLFRLGQERTILPRQVVHEEFIKRYDILGAIINTVTLTKIIWPHLLNHRLATVTNKLYKNADMERVFEKLFDHPELREEARLAEQGDEEAAYNLFSYTVSDAEDPLKALLHPKNQYIFFDLLDVCDTFGITLDQASSNANTAAHLWEKKYFENTGGVLSPGFYRQLQLDLAREFRDKYTEYRTQHLLEQGLEIEFDRGLIKEVSQLYFSPEYLICDILYPAFPEVKAFVDRTMKIKNNPERQMSRLQYVKPLIVSMLTDLYGIHKKEKEIDELKKEKEERDAKTKKMLDSEEKKQEKKECEEQAQLLYERILSLSRKKYFFNKLFGVTCEQVEKKVQGAYKKVADFINKNDNIHSLNIKGNFIYAKESLSNDVLRQAGLFRVKTNPEILNMGMNELTFFADGQYAGFPSRLDMPNYNYSMFEIRILRNVLDYIFKQDYFNALQTVNTAASKIGSLDVVLANPKIDKNTRFRLDLLRHNRSKNLYIGTEEKGKREFTEDDKHRFMPGLDYYMNQFRRNFFGLTNKDIDVNARIAKLIGGIVNMGEDNSGQSKKEYAFQRQLYKDIVSERMLAREEVMKILEPEPVMQEPSGQFILFRKK
ncbi:hypothetical protein AYK26_01890 [Euryarchaeota archaeon SM23-78]|nr:MAG: hypothetical protein AYK26_01890 [Euryarchaeota archaeon SM23-78]MBW3000331.1 hypothetical protein [Candidatus Woesearchaeota archaeon]